MADSIISTKPLAKEEVYKLCYQDEKHPGLAREEGWLKYNSTSEIRTSLVNMGETIVSGNILTGISDAMELCRGFSSLSAGREELKQFCSRKSLLQEAPQFLHRSKMCLWKYLRGKPQCYFGMI